MINFLHKIQTVKKVLIQAKNKFIFIFNFFHFGN